MYISNTCNTDIDPGASDTGLDSNGMGETQEKDAGVEFCLVKTDVLEDESGWKVWKSLQEWRKCATELLGLWML